MNATSASHTLGQSLWLDKIGRSLLRSGTLARCIEHLSVSPPATPAWNLTATATGRERSP